MPLAVRIIGVEYLQNLPILVGLMFALKTQDWLLSLLFTALGAFTTAGVISLTERTKLRENAPQQPTPLLINGVTFLAGSVIYLLYFWLVRDVAPTPVLADACLGLVLGLLMGLAQGYGRGAGRLNSGDLAHILGLMLAGAALCVVIGLVAAVLPPLIAAVMLCLLMTLIIVRLDYWSLITAR